ncbi:hypothetical protein V9T40_003938 [Parthenolecanium corni]|uniref:Nudix hydrolase domain-containing protein n=1 Tax=Parthenolecanium corni TaxID=536013 RepID=A0AAN9TGJ7_9HEMI
MFNVSNVSVAPLTVYIQSIPFEDQKGLIDCKKYPAELGLTLEFCAGIIDKDKSLEVIAQEEIMEETGYEVPASKLEKVRQFRSTIGACVEEVNLFYVEVEDDMKKAKGGGLESEGEFIEIVELSLAEAKDMCDGKSKDIGYGGFLYGLLWFFHYKAPTLNIN